MMFCVVQLFLTWFDYVGGRQRVSIVIFGQIPGGAEVSCGQFEPLCFFCRHPEFPEYCKVTDDEQRINGYRRIS